ncbi:putative UPF0481 protein [Tanacetum coccineum]
MENTNPPPTNNRHVLPAALSSMSYRFGMISSIMYLASCGGDGDYRQFSILVQPVRSLSFVEIQYAIKGFDKEFIIRKVYKVAVLDYVHLVKIGISVSCGLDYFHNGVVIQNGVTLRFFREKNVIVGDLATTEIVKLLNGITKSSVKNDGKTSELQKTILKVNNHYSNIPRVKAFNFIKKLFLATWKFFAIVFSVMSLVLMVVAGVCEVYDCKGQFGLGNVLFMFGYATGNNELTDF